MKRQILCLSLLASMALVGCGGDSNTEWPSKLLEEKGWVVPEWKLAKGESLTWEDVAADPSKEQPAHVHVSIVSENENRLVDYIGDMFEIDGVEVDYYYWSLYHSFGLFGEPVYMSNFEETYSVTAMEKATDQGAFDNGYEIYVYGIEATSLFFDSFPSTKLIENMGTSFNVVPSFAIPSGEKYRYSYDEYDNYATISAKDKGVVGQNSIEDVYVASFANLAGWTVDDSEYDEYGYIATNTEKEIRLNFFTEGGIFYLYVQSTALKPVVAEYVAYLTTFMSEKGFDISGGQSYESGKGYKVEWQVDASDTVTDESLVRDMYAAISELEGFDPEWATDPDTYKEWYDAWGTYDYIGDDWVIDFSAAYNEDDNTKIDAYFDVYYNGEE